MQLQKFQQQRDMNCMKKQKKYINSYYFVNVLSELLNKKDVIITDMGFSFTTSHQTLEAKGGQKFHTNSGHAPMGWGLPASVGAYYAGEKKNRIICLTGDGGFQLNIKELATIQHNKIPIKILMVLDPRGLGPEFPKTIKIFIFLMKEYYGLDGKITNNLYKFNLIENFEKHIDQKDLNNNCLDVAIITAPEKRSKKTIEKLKTVAGRVLNK